jgi:hypothetical protein
MMNHVFEEIQLDLGVAEILKHPKRYIKWYECYSPYKWSQSFSKVGITIKLQRFWHPYKL